MLSREDNELLTRVCGDAPMGRMLRTHCWIPAGISPQLVADGAPVRVRLLGENYVAFRATDGRVGFFDEACPHRGVSLALGRNEDNGLRCIFHGWKYSVDGVCLEMPTQSINQQAVCKGVRVSHYPVREAAGVIWVYLGSGAAPPFHEFEFTGLPSPTHVYASMQYGDFNWLQAVETTMDSSHLGILHSTSIREMGDIAVTRNYTAPTFETDHTPYGFRYASIRTMSDGRAYVRVKTFVAPWFSFIAPTNNTVAGGTIQFTVPCDDEHSLFFVLDYKREGNRMEDNPLLNGCTDLASWPPRPPGGPDSNWGQDREAMKRGHFSGFTANLLTEDLAVVTSMLPIVDRTKEQLNSADTAIVNVRRSVLSAIREFMRGETPACVRRSEIDEASIAPQCDVLPDASRWRDHFGRTSTPV
jgi:phthalate 4,5-dioxygenase oxygenase subunit